MHKRELAAWASVIASVLAIGWISLPVEPYRNVQVIHADPNGSALDFIATFEKTNCEFRELQVVGGVFGQTEILPWSDLDDLPPDFDRDLGAHTLRIRIILDQQYDWLEIRTRHDCDGAKTDRVFARIEPVPGG